MGAFCSQRQGEEDGAQNSESPAIPEVTFAGQDLFLEPSKDMKPNVAILYAPQCLLGW